MANTKVFLVSIIPDGKFFVARCPELGVTSQGESLVEAQQNLKEAIELYIESFGLRRSPDGHRIAKKLVTDISKRLRTCGSSSKTGHPRRT
jgi:predicted RNase H-like HicB family nuclease